METAGKYSVIAGCFSVPLSTTLMGLFGGLTVFFWLFSGQTRNLGGVLKRSPVAISAVILSLLFIAGLFYTPVSSLESIDRLKSYIGLFYIPVIMSLLLDDEKTARFAIDAFFVGSIILMFISFGMAAGIIPVKKYGYSIIHHIAHSFFMAILAFWAAHKAADRGRFCLYWLFLFVLVTINIVYVAPGRTGMFTFVLLILLFLWQKLSWKQFLTGFVALILFATAAAYSSDNVTGRLREAYKEIQTYKHGSSKTSIGARFDWWYDCLLLIQEKPVFGHGTGSFAFEHDLLIKGTKIKPTDNPHSEYFAIAIQLGGVGLAAFIGLLTTQWYCGYLLNKEKRYLVHGVVLSMAFGCLMNSFLSDSHQGYFYTLLTALLLIPHPRLPLKDS